MPASGWPRVRAMALRSSSPMGVMGLQAVSRAVKSRAESAEPGWVAGALVGPEPDLPSGESWKA